MQHDRFARKIVAILTPFSAARSRPLMRNPLGRNHAGNLLPRDDKSRVAKSTANTSALQFYQHCGFVACPERDAGEGVWYTRRSNEARKNVVTRHLLQTIPFSLI
jgi:hypothetical protein